MLAKTNVHHFAGNNVSGPPPPFQTVIVPSRYWPNDRLPTSRVYPKKGLSIRHWRVSDVLTSYRRSNWGLPVGSFTDAPQWPYWMLVIRISWEQRHHERLRQHDFEKSLCSHSPAALDVVKHRIMCPTKLCSAPNNFLVPAFLDMCTTRSSFVALVSLISKPKSVIGYIQLLISHALYNYGHDL